MDEVWKYAKPQGRLCNTSGDSSTAHAWECHPFTFPFENKRNSDRRVWRRSYGSTVRLSLVTAAKSKPCQGTGGYSFNSVEVSPGYVLRLPWAQLHLSSRFSRNSRPGRVNPRGVTSTAAPSMRMAWWQRPPCHQHRTWLPEARPPADPPERGCRVLLSCTVQSKV